MHVFVSSNSKMSQNRKAAKKRMLQRLGGKAAKRDTSVKKGCEKLVYKMGNPEIHVNA